MKAKEIILLIVIIFAGVLFHHAYMGKFFFDLDDEFLFFGEEFIYEESQEFEPPFPSFLQITNAHGDIEIYGTDEEKITVKFQKEIWRRKEKEALEVSDQLRMIIDRNPDMMVIATNRDEFKKRNFRTSFKIYVPAGMDVEVTNTYGEVELSKTGKSMITNRSGEIIATDISGELVIKNSYEDVEVDNVLADCEIESKNSALFLSRVEGKARIIHRYGKVHLEDISQDIEVEASNTSVYGENIKGHSDIKTSYEKITLFNIGPTEIRAHNTSVVVEGATGPLKIEDRYGKVKINNLQGDLLVDGKNLEVEGTSIVGHEINISSSYRDIELSEFSGKTTISLSNGDVMLTPLPLTHSIEVDGHYVDIKFHWPEGEEYPFEAKVKNGDFQWRLPAEFTLQEEDHLSIIKAFLERKEKPSILLSTSYRTIWIGE